MLNDDAKETLINRVRQALAYGLTRDEIQASFSASGETNEDIFFAYHAAKILDFQAE